jgi:MFS family permease
MPLIAEKVFHGGADILGYLYAAGGLGAVLATVFVSSFSDKFKSSFFINGGNTLFAVSMILFSLTHNLIFAYFFLFLAGFGLLSMFSIINARIQHLVDNNLRGRVMSLYMLVFVGFFPFGNFEIGLLSEHVGAQNAILVGAITVLIAGIIGFFAKDKIVKAHQEYISKNEIEDGTRQVIIESNKP